MRPRTRCLICMVVLGAITIAAQKRETQEFTLPRTSPTSGAEMFRAYCADCHGQDATGGGPLVAILKVAPSDLTRLSERNHGKFPYDRVSKTIRGDTSIAAHGSKEMPIWGPVFRGMGGGKAEAKLRIKTLTQYIASLQPSPK